MLALLLSVNLAAAVPTQAPPELRSPFGPGVFAASTTGAAVGDALVLGIGYGMLRLFANGTFEPTADGFRNAALALGATALVLPPVIAALFGRWAHGGGSTWRAMLYAVAGQALALGAGWAAWPRLWAFLPAQAVAVGFGTAYGLRARPARLRAGPAAPPLAAAPPGARAPLVTPVCPDG